MLTKLFRAGGLLLIFAACQFSQAFAQTPTLARLYATQDTGIQNGLVTNTGLYGFENADTNGPRRALIQWDLSGIPANATIQSAVLRLGGAHNPAGKTFSVFPLTESWVEGNGTSNGTPYQGAPATGATWLARNLNAGTPQNWTTAGGTFDASKGVSFTAGSAQDDYYNPSVYGSLYPVTYKVNADIRSIVQAWVDGTLANNGVVIRTDEASFTANAFYGREYGLAANTGPAVASDVLKYSPALEVNYVPEPGTVGLIAAAGLACCFWYRRRR